MNWHSKAPKPSNYDQMVRSFQKIAHDLRAKGIDPTNDDILKENARRIREADARKRNAA